MCLIVIALNQHPDWPLLLVANRDEFHSRPTQALGFWPDAPIIAGRDLQAGGTWMGLSRNGRFAAVTNYRDGRERQLGGASRGQLVTDFLLSASPAERYRPPEEVTTGYNLIRGDRDGLFYSGNRGGRLERLGSGIHTLSNALLTSEWPKTRRARQAMQQTLSDPSLDAVQLLEVLNDDTPAKDDQLPDTGIPQEKERLLSSCLIRSGNYGTRATTVLMQARNGLTRIVERRFDRSGPRGQSDFTLWLSPLGV
ncbi:NRDE family protein [Marinobacterium zhoushanense]|nr:NRDE family protein [Marinobacterium zhoushanense]